MGAILGETANGHHPHIPNLTPEDWSSLIGIITAIIGNILISFALNTQRYAHIRLEREADRRSRTEGDEGPDGTLNGAPQSKPSQPPRGVRAVDEDEPTETHPLIPKSSKAADLDSNSTTSTTAGARGDEKSNAQLERKNYLWSPYWWTGIVLMVIGEAGNFLAYGFAPASIVSPLGVVALISNCIIAPIMLKEQFRKRDLLGVVIAVAGAVIVVLSAKGSNPKLGPDKIWDLIKRWEFLTYLGITAVVIVLLMLASNKYGHQTIMVDIGLVGLFGGYTALATKGVASLVSFRLFDVFTFWISYLLVFVLVLTAVMQIKYVNRALQRFDSTQVIPAQFVTFTVFVVVGSAVLYRDFEQTTAVKVGQFVGGVALTFLGVWCITSGRSGDAANEDDGDDYNGDEAHEINLVDEEASLAPSPPATPKPAPAPAGPTTPHIDSPASFATAPSHRAGALSLSLPKPPLQASSSSPSVPPSKSNTKASRSHSNFHTPATPASHPRRPVAAGPVASDTLILQTPVTPPTSTSVPRHFLNRHSVAAGITPGPYLSPLNAGVGVVLSDSRTRRSSIGHRGSGGSAYLDRRRSTRQRQHSVPDAEAAEVNVSAAASHVPRRGSGVDVVDGSPDAHGDASSDR